MENFSIDESFSTRTWVAERFRISALSLEIAKIALFKQGI